MSTSSDEFGDVGAHDFYDGFDLGSLNFDEKPGLTLFHEACEHGCLDLVVQFLELGQDPNCLEQISVGIEPPLHLALRELNNNNGEVVRTLLRAGADPNLVSSKDGSTALHVICRRPRFAVDMATIFFANCDESTVRIDARDNEGWTPLQLALTAAKDVDLVALLLAKGANPMLADPAGRTSLHFVVRTYIDNRGSATAEAQSKLEEVARSMLIRGADPTLANDRGETSLHVVAWEHIELCIGFWYDVMLKISRDAIIIDPGWFDARDWLGCTPLHRACSRSADLIANSGARMAEWLLSQGADPNAPNRQGETPLHLIARNEDNLFLAGLFFDTCEQTNRAVRLNVQDEFGDTPLHVAAREGCRSMIHLLLRQGADPNGLNAEGSTPLHECCKLNANSCLLEFLATCRQVGRSLEAAVNTQDENGDTPLHLALQRQSSSSSIDLRREALRALLRLGADPNLADADGRTIQHVAAEIFGEELVNDFFALCDEFGRTIQLDARDNKGDTPLHLALDRGDDRVAGILLRRGADPTLVNARGETPLHVLSFSCCAELFMDEFLDLCDEFGWTVQLDARDNEGNTPLHLALKEDGKKTAEILLRRGAHPSLVNARGETPLHVICRGSELFSTTSTNLASEFFRVNDELQRHRIPIDARDNRGRTPLQLAVTSLSANAFDVLLDRGADLSDFVFPAEAHFEEQYLPSDFYQFRFAMSALTFVERLENRGYELDQSDALTIMRVIDKHGVFRLTVDPVTSLLNDKRFAKEAKKMTVKEDDSDSTTLYDLIQLPLKEAAKRFTHMDYYELVRDKKLWVLSTRAKLTIHAHLYEIISKRFFLDWALEPFMVLTHCRLPILCCEMIIDHLNNEDLFNICSAVESEKARDGDQSN